MKLRGHGMMRQRWPLIFFLVFLFLSSVALALEPQEFIDKAKALNLAQDPFWRDLLHFKGNRSQILDDDFFLSHQGKFDPQAELEATIKAYFGQEQVIKREGADERIVCIFPARYTWLNEKLGLPGFSTDISVCPKLNQWVKLNQIQDISIVYVSGYLGNPASSFGHVLLNLKAKDQQDLLGLFDTSISYGATVPLNENMVLYILKGLFGGYVATFSDKLFYMHDQVYTNREFRDMWEYTLNFSERDKKMLIYHLAELLTKRYRYYFLSANCAHRLAVLLDIFIKEDVYNFNYPIYVPEELFHRLKAIDQARLKDQQEGLIKQIKYIPSARRHLYYETKNLTIAEREVYQRMTKHKSNDIGLLSSGLSQDGKINVYNALLSYQYYKLAGRDQEDIDQASKQYKDKLLLERLRLPAKEQQMLHIPEIPSPKDISPPSSFTLGVLTDDGGEPFTRLGATIFRRESVGLTAIEFNELVALDLNVGFFDESDKVFIDQFDFLRIRDYRTFYLKEANENPLSWSFRAGVDRYGSNNLDFYDFTLAGGLGLVDKIYDQGIYYGLMNVSIHSQHQQYRLTPLVGGIIGQGQLKLQLEYGLEFGLEYWDYKDVGQVKLQYQLDQKNALQLEVQKNLRERVVISYIYFW